MYAMVHAYMRDNEIDNPSFGTECWYTLERYNNYNKGYHTMSCTQYTQYTKSIISNVMYNALKDMICTLHAPVHCVHMQSSIVEQQMYMDREVTLLTKISYTHATATSTVK